MGRLALHDLFDAVRPFARRRARADPYSQYIQDHAASQTTDMSPDTPPPDKLATVTELEVAMLIAMPTPHRQTAEGHVRTASTSTSLKGKEKSLYGYWEEFEEGVPDIVIGVTLVPFNGTNDG